jgi:hypothetical protein
MSLADKFLKDSESEQWIALFIRNPSLFRLIVSLYYPFSVIELNSYRSKIVIGYVERGVDLPSDEGGDDEDYESKEYFHDDNSFEYGYGLIFNKKIDWKSNDVLTLLGFSSTSLSFPNEWEGDIELMLPITIDQMKNIEKDWLDKNSMVGFNDVNRYEDEIIEGYLKKHGLTGYSVDGITGEIDPPELGKLLKDTVYREREQLSEGLTAEFDSVDTKYQETITDALSVSEFEKLINNGDLFFLINPKVWDLTLESILDKDIIGLIFGKI